MKKYLLLLYDHTDVLQEMSPEEMENLIQAHTQWADKLAQADVLEAGDGLEETGVCITGKEATVTQGPYMPHKELVGGYYLIKAENLEQAVAIAQECPCHKWGGTTEVRPIMDYTA